jgi:hypothetical protein
MYVNQARLLWLLPSLEQKNASPKAGLEEIWVEWKLAAIK